MGGYLKQSTAAAIQFGPFVDKADGVTLKTDGTTITDIDHATTGIFLSKVGSNAAVRHQNVTASVADDYGMMTVTLDTTDTNTLGRLRVTFAKAATYLPVYDDFTVLSAMVYDSLIGGGDYLDTHVVEFTADSITAAAIAAGAIDAATFAAGAIDAAAIANAAIDNATFAADVGSTAYATNILALAADKAGQNGVNVTKILASTITGTAAQIVAAFTKFFNVATPTGTVNSLPDAVPSAAGGLPIKSDLAIASDIVTAIKAATSAGKTWDHILAAIVGGMTTPPA